MVGTSDQDHLSAFTSKVQKEVGNKVVSRRRARAVGIIRGLRRSQHFISARRHFSSEAKNVRYQFFQEINGLEINLPLGKWDKNRNHQEENQNISCHILYITQVYLHPPLLTAAVSFTTNYCKQTFLQHPISKAHF